MIDKTKEMDKKMVGDFVEEDINTNVYQDTIRESIDSYNKTIRYNKIMVAIGGTLSAMQAVNAIGYFDNKSTTLGILASAGCLAWGAVSVLNYKGYKNTLNKRKEAEAQLEKINRGESYHL